jgi:starch synthase (maltosyl-transferring)
MYSGYELCENDPYPGKEEYDNSEKYELKQRDYQQLGNLTAFIRTLNLIRRDNPALHLYDNLSFHSADHPQMLCYSKVTPDFSNRILCVISHDADQTAIGMVHLDLAALGLDGSRPFKVTDLMHHETYEWRGVDNYIALNPHGVSMHIFRVEQ